MFDLPLIPGLRNKELSIIGEGPTAQVIEAIGAAELSREGGAVNQADWYQIFGQCPKAIHDYASRFRLGNLPDKNQTVIQLARESVLEITRDLMSARYLVSGVITPGGTGANQLALHIAREKKQGRVVLVSDRAHSLIRQSAKQLGLILHTYHSLDELINFIDEYGSEISSLVLTCPDTNLGYVEGVPGDILKKCHVNAIHVHVDAASGLLADPDSEALLNYTQSPWVDSMTVDPHKMLGEPNCGTLLMRNNGAMSPVLPHLPYYSPSPEIYFGSSQSPVGTLACLLHFHALGKAGIQKLRKEGLEKAHFLSQALQIQGFGVLNPNRDVPFVSIGLASQENAKKVQLALRPDYEVALVNLAIGRGRQHGIRVVLSSRPHINQEKMEALVNRFRQLRERELSLF